MCHVTDSGSGPVWRAHPFGWLTGTPAGSRTRPGPTPDLPAPAAVADIADRLASAAQNRPVLVALDGVDRCDAETTNVVTTLEDVRVL